MAVHVNEIAAPAAEAAAGPSGQRTVTFVHPLPGLAGATEYTLSGLEASGALFSLTSLDGEISLLLAAPWAFFPRYAPVVSDEDVDLLGLSVAEDALVFVVITPGESAAASTANLLAPVVLNTHTNNALQVLLTGTDEPVRAPLGT